MRKKKQRVKKKIKEVTELKRNEKNAERDRRKEGKGYFVI